MLVVFILALPKLIIDITGAHSLYKPMSENTIIMALRTIGYETKTGVSGHPEFIRRFFQAMKHGAVNNSTAALLYKAGQYNQASKNYTFQHRISAIDG